MEEFIRQLEDLINRWRDDAENGFGRAEDCADQLQVLIDQQTRG